LRLHSAIIPAVLFALGATADAETAFEWSADRPLIWDDFRGPVPKDAAESRVAATAASLGWSYEFQLKWSRRVCEFRISRIDSSATFEPSSSWGRPTHRTPEILEHEQGHFNITEIFRRKFDAATRELVDSTHACDARNERQAASNAERETENLIGAIYDNIWRQYQLEQEAYDRETRHGIDRDAQSNWTAEIALSLATDQDTT